MGFGDLIPWGRSAAPVPTTLREGERHPFLSLHREMNRLFDDVFRGLDDRSSLASAAGSLSGWPYLEVSEDDNEIRITAEIPGLDEKDIDLSVEDGVLSLRGEKRSEISDNQKRFSERYYGRFERSIALGRDIDQDRIEASYRNGVLTVTLPRTANAQSRAKKIAISN